MTKPITNVRFGGPAIAAVLALTATPALAQEVTPQATPQITIPDEPAPAATTTTTTTTTSDPLAAQPAAEVDTTAAADTPAAPVASKPATANKARPRAVAAAPAATRTAAPAADPVEAAPASAAPVDPAFTAAPPPLPAQPEAAAPVAAEAVAADDALPIALGAGLGLLALGGAAFALRRRRRHEVDEQIVATEPTIARRPAAPTPAEAPIATGRSAFNWGAPARAATTIAAAPAGSNWVERAQRGPSPENPFLSLKKRLQRAAFYDQRERAVAAGRARPLSPMAGLPRRFADAIKPRNAGQPSYGFSYALT